ncbi:MAG TPA: aldo/keto reductase [Armatimonadota bacterium]|nr:aldo/keto reductase [Armatimonadota bacterium]
MALETRYVPKLGRSVTRLGLGALPMGPLQRGLTVEEGARVVRAAVEGGVSFIDTATAYGTYEHVARGLFGWQGTVTVATKTHARADGAAAREHIEMARRELGRDVIDIMLCHCARSLLTREEWGPTLDALLEAKAKGRISLVGLSSHAVEGVRIAARHPDIDVVHPLINLTGMGIVDGTVDEMIAATAEAHDAGKFVYGMKALAGGNLVPRREEALQYAFGLDVLDTIAVGMVTPDEVEWNLRFAQSMAIPKELSERTAAHSKRLNILTFVCQGCGKCVDACENAALSVVEGKAVVDVEQCILCGYCAPHCPMFAIRMV